MLLILIIGGGAFNFYFLRIDSIPQMIWIGDILLPVTIVGCVLACLRSNYRRLVPPLGIQIFLLCLLAIEILQSENSLKELLQLGIYVYGSWVLVNFISTQKKY